MSQCQFCENPLKEGLFAIGKNLCIGDYCENCKNIVNLERYSENILPDKFVSFTENNLLSDEYGCFVQNAKNDLATF